MILSDGERQKFADYLDLEATSADAVAGQMAALPGPAMTQLRQREETLAMACRIIAARLRSSETFTIK